VDPTWPTLKDVLLTAIRWSAGLAGATVGGLVLAMFERWISSGAVCRKGRAARIVMSLGDFCRALPVIALVPLVQMFGVSEWWKIGLVSWAGMFPIWLSIRDAQARQMIDTELALVATGMRSRDLMRQYQLPKVAVGLVGGIQISIGVSWIAVVAAEWVGTFTNGFWAGGLGYRVVKAHDANGWAGMLACLSAFGALGVGSSAVWHWMSRGQGCLPHWFRPLSGNGD
jgi:sulfonate transport system permease protein